MWWEVFVTHSKIFPSWSTSESPQNNGLNRQRLYFETWISLPRLTNVIMQCVLFTSRWSYCVSLSWSARRSKKSQATPSPNTTALKFTDSDFWNCKKKKKKSKSQSMSCQLVWFVPAVWGSLKKLLRTMECAYLWTLIKWCDISFPEVIDNLMWYINKYNPNIQNFCKSQQRFVRVKIWTHH